MPKSKIPYEIRYHKLPECRICFTDLEKLREKGRKVYQFCSTACRVENKRRKEMVNQVIIPNMKPEDIPVVWWTRKTDEKGNLLPASRRGMFYSTRKGILQNGRSKLVKRRIKVKKGKPKKSKSDYNQV